MTNTSTEPMRAGEGEPDATSPATAPIDGVEAQGVALGIPTNEPLTLFVVDHGHQGVPQLFSAPLVRETAQFYFIERGQGSASAAFRYRERIVKAEAVFTPRLAWWAYRHWRASEASRLTAELERAKQQIAVADEAIASVDQAAQ